MTEALPVELITLEPVPEDIMDGGELIFQQPTVTPRDRLPSRVVDLLTRPTRLSQDQISDILKDIPEVRGATKTSAEMARQSIISSLTEQLRDVEITPLGIHEFKQAIINRFELSSIEPGTIVGTRAAEALAGPITQMALKTFHFSGSSKNVSTGVDAMSEILNVTKERKRENMTIRFKDQNLSHDEVVDKQADLVGVMVSDILSDFEVESAGSLERYWWHDVFPSVVGRTVPQSGWVLRLTFDVNALFAYKIELEQLASSIEAGSPEGIVCVYSPTGDGIIDIYPDENLITESIRKFNLSFETSGSMIFLTQIVQPNLGKIQIKGVPGIRKLYPVTIPVWSVVYDETKAYGDDHIRQMEQQDPNIANLMRRTWFLIFNRLKMRTSGIRSEKLRRLCELTGMSVSGETEDLLVVTMPDTDNLGLASNGRDVNRPSVYIQTLVEADNADENRYESEQRTLKNPLFRRPPSAFYKASRFVYADTDGANLRRMLGREDVDSEHTVSSNQWEIFTCLGIEACRNFLVSELLNTITMEGEYVNPRNIVTLAEFMTNRGEPLAITYGGVSRQPIGPLVKSSFQRQMDTFAEASGFGRSEDIKSTSTSIFVGKRVELGTGFPEVRIDEEMVDRFQRELEQENPLSRSELDAESFGQAIDQMTDLTFESGNLDFNDENEVGDVGIESMFVSQPGGSLPPPGRVTIDTASTLDHPQTIELKPEPILPQQLVGVVNRLADVKGTVQRPIQQNPVVSRVQTPTRTPIKTASLPQVNRLPITRTPMVQPSQAPMVQPSQAPTLPSIGGFGGFTGGPRFRGERLVQQANVNDFLQ